MKTAIWILSIVVVGLGTLAIYQYNAIQKLTPAAPKRNSASTTTDTSDALASFGNQIDATKKAIKDLEIKATFQS